MQEGAGDQRTQKHISPGDLPAPDDWKRRMAELQAQDVAGPGAPREHRRANVTVAEKMNVVWG